MKARLLVSVATVALAVGTAMVYAEQGAQPGGKAAPGAQTPDAPPSAGDKKGRPKENGEPKQGGQPKATEPKQGAQPKATEPKQDPKQGAQPKATEPKPEPKAKTEPSPKAPTDPKAKAGGQPDRPDDKGATKGKQDGPRTGDQGAGTTVQITTQQRTEIRQTIIKQGGAPRVDRVDFDVRIGIEVPRTIKVVVLPPRVIEIYPQWRGYRYFIVGERIIVVEPDRLVIVYIIEA